MKSIRKRAIEKAMSKHVCDVIDMIDWNAHTLAVCGSAPLTTKREIELLNTLEHYANIADRVFKDGVSKNEFSNKEWALELTMYL